MAEQFEVVVAGRTLSIQTGKLAQLANGSCLVRYGDTVVLTTATTTDEPREGIDFFPLTVEFEEKLYAAGKIPGSFPRREGRPGEFAILSARLTDRPIRPLFPKDYRNDVQVISTVLSADQANDPAILSIIGASAALTISDIPFHGPVGAVKMGYVNGEFVVNPTLSQLMYSELDLTVAGTTDAVLMVEAGARELPEDLVLQAIDLGHKAMQPIIQLQLEMQRRIGKPKRSYPVVEVPPDLRTEVEAFLADKLEAAIYNPEKQGREDATWALKLETMEHFQDRFDPKMVAKVFEQIEKEVVRRNILEYGRRPDGRGPRDIRPVSAEVGVLPRTHGSGLFTRGQTQVLSVATLGTVGDEQIIDSIGLQETKRYLHHYNFPPYSTGEVRPLRGPSRRDIGHGALAERALLPVIPDEDIFPYTIRVVSEVLSSNGSTSMASTCGSTLALMDAGVPIKAPVAGIAMGLVTPPEGGLDRYEVLTDIQGIEDALGDMDLKVAGTERGVTAIQMDIKIRGISTEIMRRAMAQARDGRLIILGKMLDAISAVRPTLSPYAPRIHRMQVHPDKIREIIGPGGKMIRKIQEECKCTIDVEDDGTVLIGSSDAEGLRRAIQTIERLTREVEVGQIYTGKVTRIMNFGAFVEILPGKEGLVHISELADYRVARVEDVVNIGDEVTVVVTEIDRQGRVNLSRRALLAPSAAAAEEAAARPGGPPPRRAPAPGRGAPSPARGGGQPGLPRRGPATDGRGGGGFRGGPPPRRQDRRQLGDD